MDERKGRFWLFLGNLHRWQRAGAPPPLSGKANDAIIFLVCVTAAKRPEHVDFARGFRRIASTNVLFA